MKKQLIIICRHGQTNGNKIKNKILGLSNDSLNSVGIKQAKVLARKIKNYQIKAIFSSEVKRTLQTAEIISRSTGVLVKMDKRLNEYDFGAFTGKIMDRKEIYKGINSPTKRFIYKLPLGESDRDVVKRIRSFADEIVRRKVNAVVCTHSFPAFALRNILLGHKINDFANLSFEDMKHDEIIVIQR